MAVLDRVHPALDLGQPRERIVDADGQPEQHEAEAVAELARERPVERAQVEGHERVHLVDLVALVAEVAADRRGHGGDEHVVDGRAVGAAGALDAPERDGCGPGDAVGDRLLALDRGARVGAGKQQLGERLRVAGGASAASGRACSGCRSVSIPSWTRPATGRDAEAGRGARRRSRLEPSRCPASGSPPSVSVSITRASAMPSAMLWWIRTRIAQPGPEVVDQVDLPQRAGVVERGGDAVADEVLERRAVVRRGQRHVMEVQVGIEAGSSSQCGPRQREPIRGALAEAVEARDDAVEEDGSCSAPSRRARRTRGRC